MKNLIAYSRISFFLMLTFLATQSWGADTSWGVKSKFIFLLQEKLQKDPVARDFFDKDWNIKIKDKDITGNASTYTKALNKALQDKSLFDNASTDSGAIALFNKLFKVSGTTITWNISFTDENLKDKLKFIAQTIRDYGASQAGLTPPELIQPCCQSDERQTLFKKWVKIDPTNNTVTIEHLTNDNAIINQALVDVAAAINTIEDIAYYDRSLPAYDQRGVSSDSGAIATNLMNLELRIGALEGQKQTFCFSDKESELNCPHATTMTGTTCTINPECKAHPSSIVNLKLDNQTRTINIIKRTITLFSLFPEEQATDALPKANMCLSCSRESTDTETLTQEPIEIHYTVLSDDTESDLEQYINPPPPEKLTALDGFISTLIDASDPLQRHIIHYACEGCSARQAEWLQHIIDNGGKEQIDMPRADGNTPLHIVAQLAQKQNCDPTIITAMIDVLKNNGATTTIDNELDKTTTPNAGTPIDVAIFTSYYSGNGENGKTATAAEKALTGLENQYKKITNNPFMPIKPDGFAPKTFFEAAIQGDLVTFKQQLEALKTAGNKQQLINMPDYIDPWQRTALHYAASGCKKEHAEIVKLLLDNGADVNARSSKLYYLDEQGIKSVSGSDTPLHSASGAAFLAESTDQTCDPNALATIMQLLLDKGADAHALNAEGRRAFDITALLVTQNTEATTVLMNYALKPCTSLANDIKNKKPIQISTIAACLQPLKFIEGTHVRYQDKAEPIYYYLAAYDEQTTDAQKIYFLETTVSQLEGIYGLFTPTVESCTGNLYAYTPQEKNLVTLGLDFIKIMQSTDTSAQDLPTLLGPKSNQDCRTTLCALRLLRVIANMVQPDTALIDTSSDTQQQGS